MTTGLLPLAMVIALGSAVTVGLVRARDRARVARAVPANRSEVNRDIERRLDLVVNGVPPRPSPSPYPWREKP